MKAFAIFMILSLLFGSCVAFCYREEIDDFQTYTRQNLQPNLRGYGHDLAE